jgi:hypothetical protein
MTLAPIPCRDYAQYIFTSEDGKPSNLPPCCYCGGTPQGIVEINIAEFAIRSYGLPRHAL